MKKKILITGSGGFLGSKLATKLVYLNYEVIGLDNCTYSNTSLDHLISFENFLFIKGDVRNKILLKRLLKNVDYIFPLAALVGAPLCEKKKLEAYEVNFEHVKFIADTIKSNQKIIFPSSDSVYGKMKTHNKLKETDETNPISHYGKLKLEAEQYVLKKNAAVIRLGTVFGISYRPRLDLLVNNFVNLALNDGKITIFEGNYKRNFVCIDDVVNCFHYLTNSFGKFKGEIVNLGLELGNVTKIDLAKKVKKQIKNLKIIEMNNKKDLDQRDYIVCTNKIKKKGFIASTTLDKGISDLINYMNKKKLSIEKNY